MPQSDAHVHNLTTNLQLIVYVMNAILPVWFVLMVHHVWPAYQEEFLISILGYVSVMLVHLRIVRH